MMCWVLHRGVVFIAECFSAGVDESNWNESESWAGGGVLETRCGNLMRLVGLLKRLAILAKWY